MHEDRSRQALEFAQGLLQTCGIDSASLSPQQALAKARSVSEAARRFARADAGDIDLGAVFDQHIACEFERQDVEATMQTMVTEPYLDHVPVMTGGVGYEEVHRFYRDHFIGKWPRDTRVEHLSRTVDCHRVIDELVVSFTHDLMMDAMLPGVAPTHRFVELPHVVVMRFEGGKIAHEHIYWDQASLLVQVGLLDPADLPVTGAEQARKLRDVTSLPSNGLISGFAGAA